MDPALQELAAVAGAEEIEAIIKLRDPGEVPPHVRVVTRFGDIATCRLAGNRIEEVWAHPACLSLKAARLLEFDSELYLEEQSEDVELRETDARRPAGISATGRDVVIGVVDWGVDLAHKNLVNPDGSTRFLAVWDQRDGPSDAAPQPYGYGRVLTRDDIDAALATEQPYEALGYHPEEGDPLHNGAHGTHVLDIAAGNGAAPASPMGLAPEADLVFVHLSAGRLGGLATLGDSVRILEALDFIRRTAGEQPWVINTSLGRHSGGHRGLSLVEQGMDAMLLEAPGRAIVQSCGNYYRAHAHAGGRLLPGRSRVLTWRTSRADVTPNELEIWYPVGDRFHVTMRPPIGNGVFKAGLGEITPIVIAGEEVGRIYHRKLDPTGEHHIDIFLRPGAPSGDWQVELSAIDAVDGRFDAYVERDPGCPDCQSRFHPDDFEPRRTLGSICNGFHTVAVGAYDAHDPDRRLGTFSSSGPTRDGRLRPNLVAPGVSVLAARSAARDPEAAPMMTRKTGTSMAAPHVTGTIALMFEAASRPLRIRETHRLLLSTTDEAEGDADFQLRIGTGYLNIAGAVEAAAGGIESLPVGEAKGIEMQDHTGETRVDAPVPVLVEEADEQPLTPDTEEEIGSGNEGAGEEFEGIEGPDQSSVDAEATEALDEPSMAAEETEAFDEPRRAVEEIDSRAPTPEELVDRAATAVASADVLRVMGPEAITSPALLFDSLACNIVPGLREHLEASFDVVALPGESLEDAPQPGDIVVVRALAEGDLAFAEVIVEDCPESAAGLHARVVSLDESSGVAEMRRVTDSFGRLDHSTVILRPIHENHTLLHHPRTERLRVPGPVVSRAAIQELKRRRIYHEFVRDIESVSEAIPSHSVGAADLRARRFVTMPAHIEDWVPNAAGTGLVLRRVKCRTEAELAVEIPAAPSEISRLPVWRNAPASSPSPGRLQAALDLLVYHPSGSAGGTTLPGGKFPLAIICMGNHNAYASSGGSFVEVPSYQGYSGFATTTPTSRTGAYLQEALAQIGVVSVSVSTNAANLLNLLVETRARLVVAAITEMQRLARKRGSRYFRKIDFRRVALIGHSRGGDAVLRAAPAVPRGVSVKALIQLAPTDITGLATGTAPSLPTGAGPTDYITTPMRTRARDRLFHFITWGSRDGDVSGLGDVRAARFGGPFRHYDRSSSQRAFHFWHGGTHNRFNRFWTDAQEGLLVDLAAGGLLSRADQEARTVEAVRSLLLFRLHSERPESQLFDGRRRTAVAVSLPITGMWKFGRRLRTIDRFDDVRPTHNTMGGRNTTPATGVFDEVTVANENPPNAGVRAFQIPHIDRALRYSPAPLTGVVGMRQAHWRTAIPSRYRRFDRFDVLTFRVTKRYLPAALACTPPGCTPATRPAVRVRLFDASANHTEAAAAVLTAMPPIRQLALGSGIDLTKYPYETWEVDLSNYSGIRLRNVRFVELHVTTEPGQPVYIDTLSLVKHP